MARLTTQDRRGATSDGNKCSLLLSVTFTVECFSPWLFHGEARSLRLDSNPLVSNDTKSSRTDELLIVDDIAPSNATHFVQPLGYAEAIDR